MNFKSTTFLSSSAKLTAIKWS